MRIGVMNHPARDVFEEIRWIGSQGFDFVDLTFEPPAADPGDVDAGAIRSALDEHGLGVIAHSAWYVPVASPFAGLRAAALGEFRRALDAGHRVGADVLTVHYDVVSPHRSPFFPPEKSVEWHAEVLRALCNEAAGLGVTVVIENTGGTTNLKAMKAILRRVPALGFHLDGGHAALGPGADAWNDYLRALGDRLRHVHLSENDGSSDQHLPLCASPRATTDWRERIRGLKAIGYDATITLEVFSRDREYVLLSRDLLRKWWDEDGNAECGMRIAE